MRSRQTSSLNCNIEEGHLSAALCHLANISYRTGRALNFDGKTESFGSDYPANQLLARDYRAGFVVPEQV